MRTFFTAVVLLLAGTWLGAMPDELKIDESGAMSIAGLNARLVLEQSGQKRIAQSAQTMTVDSGYPILGTEVFEFQGRFLGNDTQLFQKIRKSDSDTVLYTAKILPAPGSGLRECALDFFLSPALFEGVELLADGRKYSLSETWRHIRCKELIVPFGNRRLVFSGELDWSSRDLRKRGNRRIQLMLHSSPSKGKAVSEARLNFFLKIGASDLRTLNPAQAAGAVATGREATRILHGYGVSNTTSSIKCGSLELPMPSRDGSILAVPGGGEARLAVRKGRPSRYLYLIHYADGEAAPQIVWEPADGKPQVIRLRPGVDFSGNKPSARIGNGAVCSYNPQTKSGLYFSCFDLKGVDAGNLRLKNSGSGTWHVVSLALSPLEVPSAGVNSIHVMQENRLWRPLEPLEDTRPGSILDFSAFQHRPAGKFGPVKVDADGHFFLERKPGERIRFLGANIVASVHLADRENTDRSARNMAALGYNTVRLHHIDDLLGSPENSLDFQPEALDRLDYCFHSMKEHGLYITTDLYTKRSNRKNESVQGGDKNCFKKLIIFDPRYRENWKEYARRLLTHKNPYTGMTWAEDPALMSICLINEPLPFMDFTHPLLQEPVQKGFDAWLKKRNLWSEQSRLDRSGPEFMCFVIEANHEFNRDAFRFLREELGYRGLITTNNHRSYPLHAVIRDELDIVDNHQYWDHPFFTPNKQKWGYPVLHCQTSALKAGNWLPRTVMAGRIFGKPYTITEYNFTYPNRYRAEGGPLMGGYAALQDWDALYRFSYWGHMKDRIVHGNPINRFDIAEDPVSLCAERLIWALFLRGDLAAAEEGVAWPYGEKSCFRNWQGVEQSVQPIPFQNLGFYCRIGSLREDRTMPGVRRLSGDPKKLDAELTAEERAAAHSKNFRSRNGEIVSGPDGCVIVTPKTESITVFGGSRKGKVLGITGADSFQSVSVIAMDNRPLTDSRRILLMHQSDVVSSGLYYTSDSEQAVLGWGTARQLLVRRAVCRVELSRPGRGKIHVLGLDGRVKGNLAPQYDGQKMVFDLDTEKFNGTLLYEIQMEP